MTVFEATDYRDYLQDQIESSESRGLISRMAEAAQCQRSHISRVIGGEHQLTLEQAFRLARFFHLNDDEETYFMKLVERDRSGDVDYRAKLDAELARIKAAQEDLSSRMKDGAIGVPESEMLYYSSWYWSAIHIIVSIPAFQKTPAIAQRLGLAEPFVEICLQKLAELGLVRQEKGRWLIAGGGVHLSRHSPLNSVQHSNWRSRAVLASQMPQEDGVHYTVVQSISRKDFGRVKRILLDTIDEYARIAKPSAEEELVCLTCDFFKV